MATRTVPVRIELPNPDGRLRAGLFAEVALERTAARPVVAIPNSAVIDSGTRRVAFVSKGEGLFEPRNSTLGARANGYVEIKDGIAEGEDIVVSGNFLIDAESNLKAALAAFTPAEPEVIARLIDWSARNLVLVLIGTVFATLAGVYALTRLPLDAIPDLSDTQVIVYTEYQGQAPQVIEDQVTFLLATAMLSVPRSRVVRGFSFFGVSFVYVIFEDGTDIYWARSRVLEYLNTAARRLPAGVTPSLGPDASGVGWVYQYALHSKNHDLAELRSLQDWQVRFGVAKAEGVAEVASVGGFVKQYAVVVDPRRMKELGVTLEGVRNAVRASNMDVGGRTVELAETEFMIRGRGYLKSPADLDLIMLKASNGGTPVLIKDIARVELVPDERRGIAEFNGEGEVASGIAVQRYGANALDVIAAVKARLADLRAQSARGRRYRSVYDRSDLIHRAIATLARTLAEESAIVALVCFLFLLHARSALVAIITLPIGILIAMTVMYTLGIGSNIMSLGGIAIAIGAMVDASIVMVENAHKRLEQARPGGGPARGPHRGGAGSRPGAVLQPAGHHRVLPADLRARSAGGAAVQAARLHQDLRHGCCGHSVGHARACADAVVHSRAHHAGSEKIRSTAFSSGSTAR